MLLLLFSLFLRIRKQKADIQQLNKNLKSSKVEIENQVERLKQKNKELEQFAYVASHDLKSPLHNISSFAGLLKRKYSSEEANEFLDIIVKSAKNMSEMISELLKLSTLDKQLNLENVNFEVLINETLQRIDTQIKDAKATINIDESCNRTIQCDKTFINVIQNLVSNSIIYCKEDELPIISISALVDTKEITIRVTDNGIGIDESYKDQVFEMFKRLKTKKVEGTGIGLASCKKIVENHNGEISVESSVGKGSTFTIKLPIISLRM